MGLGTAIRSIADQYLYHLRTVFSQIGKFAGFVNRLIVIQIANAQISARFQQCSNRVQLTIGDGKDQQSLTKFRFLEIDIYFPRLYNFMNPRGIFLLHRVSKRPIGSISEKRPPIPRPRLLLSIT